MEDDWRMCGGCWRRNVDEMGLVEELVERRGDDSLQWGWAGWEEGAPEESVEELEGGGMRECGQADEHGEIHHTEGGRT